MARTPTSQRSFLRLGSGHCRHASGSAREPSAEICVVDAVPFAADGEIQNGDAIKDNIMLCKRGGTTFVEKVKRAAEAGAVGVIIVNTEGDCLNEKYGFGTHAYPASSLIRGAGASRSSRTSNSLAIERE